MSSSICCSQVLRGRPGRRFQSAAGGVPVWASIDSCSACVSSYHHWSKSGTTNDCYYQRISVCTRLLCYQCSCTLTDDDGSWYYEDVGGVPYMKYLRPVAYITACTTVQAVMSASNLMHQLAWPHRDRTSLSRHIHWSRRFCWRRQSLFGHIARLADGVPAHDAVKLQVDLSCHLDVHWPRLEAKRRPRRRRTDGSTFSLLTRLAQDTVCRRYDS